MKTFENERKLRERAKKWSPEQWEEYLKTLEVARRENNLARGHFSNLLSQEDHDDMWDFCEEDRLGEKVRKQVRMALATLPPKFQECIRLIFWEGHTLAKTANIMGVNKTTIIRWKQAMLPRLRGHLESECPDLAVVMGGSAEELTKRELFVVKRRLGMIPGVQVKISKKEGNKLFKSARQKIEAHCGKAGWEKTGNMRNGGLAPHPGNNFLNDKFNHEKGGLENGSNQN